MKMMLMLFTLIYLTYNVECQIDYGYQEVPTNHFYSGNDVVQQIPVAPSHQAPPWFFPECPGGRVTRRRDGTLHCCQRTVNDTCRHIRKQFTLFDDDPARECPKGRIIGCSAMSLCCSGIGRNMTCTPIRKQDDEIRQAPVTIPRNQTQTTTVAPTPLCPGGRFIECGPMKFCCTGSGFSESCRPLNK